MKTQNLVTDTKAAQSIRAQIVLDAKGDHVATIHAHFSDSGRVLVNVTQWGDAATNSLKTAIKHGRVNAKDVEKAKAQTIKSDPYLAGREDDLDWHVADSLLGFQSASASGHGYDKFSAATRGMIIDGHIIYDHSAKTDESEKALKGYVRSSNKPAYIAKCKKRGIYFANYSQEHGRYMSAYMVSGLDLLACLGYRVITAI